MSSSLLQTSKQRQSFRMTLNTWFIENRKDYPWRRTQDPYAILVSELMLQQTQISTVLERGYYTRWLETFPDWQSLAQAPEEQVLATWQGLGYYNRARRLHELAKTIVEQYQGQLPQDYDTLLSLKGIGDYTAAAVSAFAFDLAYPLVDGNVIRLLSRLYNYQEAIDKEPGKSQIWTWAAELLDTKNACVYNAAIMEIGQQICKKKPQCLICPVADFCQAKDQQPELLPIKKARPKITHIDEHAIICMRDHQILLAQETGSRRKGFWKLPNRTAQALGSHRLTLSLNYAITRYKVELYLYAVESQLDIAQPQTEEKWTDIEDLDSIPLGAPYKKAIQQYLAQS